MTTLSDTWYPHHPDESPAGDYCVNSRPGDTWYLVVDEMSQGTSWHIHPVVAEGIYNFIINEIISAYGVQTVLPPLDIETEHTIRGIVTSFSLMTPIVSNFDLTSWPNRRGPK